MTNQEREARYLEVQNLLPPRDILGQWQRCVYDAILEIQKEAIHYHWPKGKNEQNRHSGSIKDRYKEGVLLLKAGNPPGAYCCGATFEAFLLAWERFVVLTPERDLTLEQAQELYKFFFVWETPDGKYQKGAAGGICWLAEEMQWFKSLYLTDPERFPFGTFVQMHFEANPFGAGHSTIVVGQGMRGDDPVLIVWSANYGYQFTIQRDGFYYQVVMQEEVAPSGHGLDFYLKDKIHHTSTGLFKRAFEGAFIDII